MTIQRKHWLWMVVATAAAFCFTPGAMAKQAGGGTLTNNVTVNYEDANGSAYSASDSVTVTLNTIFGVAWTNETAQRLVDAGTATTTTTDEVAATLTNVGNAPDTPEVISARTSGTIAGATHTYNYSRDFGPNGATGLTSWTNAETTGVNPSMYVLGIDETAGTGGVISGVGTGAAVIQLFDSSSVTQFDMITIDGVVYEVAAVDAGGANTITVDDTTDNLVNNDTHIPDDGLIHQQLRFFRTGQVGTLTPGTDTQEDHDFDWQATDENGTGTQVDTVADALYIAVVGPLLEIEKYVRNTSAASGGGASCASITMNSNTYFANCTGADRVDAEEGDVLEYLVFIQGGDGKFTTTCFPGQAQAGNCASVSRNTQLTDVLPDFTTLQSSASNHPGIYTTNCASGGGAPTFGLSPDWTDVAADLFTDPFPGFVRPAC